MVAMQLARGPSSRALLARQAERVGHRPAEQRIAERGEHQPQRGLVHRPVLMALAELVDQLVDRRRGSG